MAGATRIKAIANWVLEGQFDSVLAVGSLAALHRLR
jgi:hypothetical protein